MWGSSQHCVVARRHQRSGVFSREEKAAPVKNHAPSVVAAGVSPRYTRETS